MGFYENHILPRIIDSACSTKPILKQREKIVPQAKGRVLEVGMGSAINLPFYNADNVEMVWGLEPSEGMRLKAAPRLSQSAFPVEWLGLPGEEIPLDDNAADTVLLTFTLCTIPDFAKALEQMRRVLKPGGKLLFSEHGSAPDEDVRKWQDRVNPVWKIFAGGCNINRDVPRLLKESGFKIESLETMYLPGTPRVAAFQYWGVASER